MQLSDTASTPVENIVASRISATISEEISERGRIDMPH
jgi:hypothetical protein